MPGLCLKNKKTSFQVYLDVDFLSLPFGRGSRVEGRGSRVTSRASRVNGRGSRVNGRGSRVTSRGSKNSSQLFLSVVKSKFHIGPCLLEFLVPVLLSDRCVNQPARLLPFAGVVLATLTRFACSFFLISLSFGRLPRRPRLEALLLC